MSKNPSRVEFELPDFDPMKTSNRWNKEQLQVAMNVYCTLPFGRFHSRNPVVIEIAGLIGRTPSALAMKLSNLASLDPFHQKRGVKGLSAASDLDREVWEEFQQDWEKNAFDSEAKLAELRGNAIETFDNPEEPEVLRMGLDQERLVKQRVNQNFFRKSVLAAYDYRCCITGLAIPELLNASHIIPWAERKDTRVNPANGLCLNALHDRAFDRGLIAISDDYSVLVSGTVSRKSKDRESHRLILEFEGAGLQLPERFRPEVEFLQWHREKCFRG